MKKQFVRIASVLLLGSGTLMAQNSYKETPSVKWYSKAVLAFDKEEYSLAKEYLQNATVDDYKEPSVQVYKILTNLALNEDKAGVETEKYLKSNPFTSQRTELILALSNYYFQKNQYKKALDWFEQLDVKLLTSEQENNYNYKLAFANYTQKNYVKAKQYLLPISKSGAYQNEAHYYLGNIAMENQDYETALYHFNQLENVTKYNKEIGYQKLVILYHQKQYQKVVDLGEAHYPQVHGLLEQSEMSKIIGESYFYLHNYKKAVLYLSNYKGRHKKFTEADYYFLGYAYYQLKDYNAAIDKFNKITDEKSAVSQNAHYHLGDCYLKLNQKTQALNAFKNASEMDFDAEITQNAYLNYAKLSYEIGNPYESSSEVLQAFVDDYPNSPEASLIEGLIVNAYLQYKDYQGAIDYYDTQKLVKDKQYQQILLQRGFELFTAHKYKEALSFFGKSANMYDDKITKLRALFWMAESLSEMYNFKDAAYEYEMFLKYEEAKKLQEYPDAVYGLAYGLFQQKKYKNALTYFEKYLTLANDSAKKRNAVLRIADCHFVNKTYWSALENYNKVIKKNTDQVDYAMYQKALSYGFLGKDDQKKEALKTLQNQFKTSAYLDKSYYELGNLLANKSQNNEALAAYDDLIFKFPKSPLVAKAKLKTGIILFNTNNNEGSVKILRQLVADYPGTAEAVQAVKMAEQVYKDMDQVDVYAKWATQLEFMNISDADIDKSMFEVAENKYFANELKEAISSCKKYLINFPNGIHALTVHFYLAQAYFNTGAKENAVPEYQEVLKVNTNEYTEVTLNKLSQIYLENENWEAASKLLLRIEKETTNAQSKVYAQSNLMKYYYQKEDYKQVLVYTNIVLNNNKSSEDAVADAYVYGARSSVELKEFATSKTYYQKLETIGKGNVKAEANYYKAFWLHQDKAYQKSNEQVQLLASKFQGYKYWGVKGLLLMAKNFHALNDDFQANFILNNVIKNAVEFNDVTQEAKALLKEYKGEEAKEKQPTTTVESKKVKEEELVLEAVNEM
ncbi:tetratricopeptide repeat protein [Wenyingzhuangia sp. IMCC45467]